MKRTTLLAIALGIAIAAPLQAIAETQASGSGTVCGHVNASQARIVALLLDPAQRGAAVVTAQSATQQVQAPVDLSGNYCLRNLAPTLYTVSAFGGDTTYRGNVTPVAGATIRLDLSVQN
jgi:hypothetical protein